MSYNIFVSHSWSYSDYYDRLISLLEERKYFDFRDYSVPKNDPIHDAKNDAELKKAIRAQMEHASCVLILAGVYATYSKWINIEIELAQELGKSIIAIEPWGAEKTSSKVKGAADTIVGWNTESIVDAIRELS